jgi:hypothetical protein
MVSQLRILFDGYKLQLNSFYRIREPRTLFRVFQSYRKIFQKNKMYGLHYTIHPCIWSTEQSPANPHLSLNAINRLSFCQADRLLGYLIFTSTIKSPLRVPSLGDGIPSPGKTSVHSGPVGVLATTRTKLPSIVGTRRAQPVADSRKLISTLW